MATRRRVGVTVGLWLLVCAAAAVAQPAPAIVGVWQAQDGGVTLVLSLKADGTGTFDDAPIRYQLKGTTLLVEDSGVVNSYGFVLRGDELVLSGGDLDAPLTFRRAGAPARGGLGARAREAGAGTRGSSGGSTPAPPADRAGGPGALIGRWQSQDSVVAINADGTLAIDGTPYRYTLQGRVLTLIGHDGTLTVPYEVSGDTLTVSIEGQVVTLQRMRDGVPGPGGASAGGPGGGVAELAGKWCYVSNFTANVGGRVSDECFTLYPNGTYTYHRETSSSGQYGSAVSQQDDSGTVTLQGSVLTVHSRSQGTLTYQLTRRNHPKTNDPMLCLDGQCYVTYGPRAPWR